VAVGRAIPFLVPVDWPGCLLLITDLGCSFDAYCFLGLPSLLVGAPRRMAVVVLITYINMVVWPNAIGPVSAVCADRLEGAACATSVVGGYVDSALRHSPTSMVSFLPALRHFPWPRVGTVREFMCRGRVVGGIFLLTNLPFFLLSLL